MDGVRSHHEDIGVAGERGEDEEDGRAEEKQLHFGGGGDHDVDTVGAATSASALPTNLLPLEVLPTTSSTQGPLELTNPCSELTSLGKITGCHCTTHCLLYCSNYFIYLPGLLITWFLHSLLILFASASLKFH